MLPTRCPGCGSDVDRDGTICAGCWQTLTFIAHPHCTVCGRSFELAPPTRAVCGGCLAKPPAYDRARSAVLYDAASRNLILAFKHGDRLTLTALFVHWLRAAGGPLIDDADCVIPVPLHPLRLIARRYNQAAVLARGLSELAGIPVVDRLLIRGRNTPSQWRLTVRQRAQNMRGAFALRNKSLGTLEVIEGRRVLLIDDVLTTGATVNACARVLKAGGASAVDVLTVARVC